MVVFSTDALAQLTGQLRDTFVQSSISSCSSTVQHNHPDFPAATIGAFCICMANKEADITTDEDMAYISEHKTATPDYRQRVQALAPSCNSAAGLH